MSMIAVDLGESGTHEYASGITVGEVILNVHGKLALERPCISRWQ